ncbi:NAD(P)-dependent oxidoreductase [Streptomyces zhihengii]|uniref:NAD(P)-dependent oxidoreductase n=1 Tax=Streptomyces zhihengii TaxID=1818004 RepID=UPI0036453B49
MTTETNTPVTVLGLGAMGTALAGKLVGAGHRTTVWNRSPGRTGALVAGGAVAAGTPAEAIRPGGPVVVCLLDHASVHEVLDPLAGELSGRAVVNLTTHSPAQSRELGAWAAAHGIAYLDGGIMAVPAMIGGPGAALLYSGSAPVFEEHHALLELWGDATYFGDDAGMASLYDLALLAGMYVMFAGFLHGAAMVAPAGVRATDFAALAAPWLSAMTGGFQGYAEIVDGGDYTVPGQQSLEFSDLGDILAAGAEQGVADDAVAMVQRLIRRQIDAGHGKEGFARIFESIKNPA